MIQNNLGPKLCTLLDHCLKNYTTLWNIWTYQLLCKKITQLVYNFTQLVYNFKQVVYFLTQQLVRFICFTVLCNFFKQWSNSVPLKRTVPMGFSTIEKNGSNGIFLIAFGNNSDDFDTF